MACWVRKPCNRACMRAFLKTSVVLPPDSEIVAPFSVQSDSGIRPGSCSLVEPSIGCTLVDASSWSACVFMVNPNAEEIILPSFIFVGDLVPVSAVSVALADSALPGEMCAVLPDHLENIVTGSHPSLGETGRQLLRNLLHRYEHVFPAPGEPVTCRTISVQHEIRTSDARPVRFGPCRLARPVSVRNRHVLRKCCCGVRLSPVIVLGFPGGPGD